jgi:hypothetical protein
MSSIASKVEDYCRHVVQQYPLLVVGGLVAAVPVVVVFGMSLFMMLSAVLVPLLIPLIAVAGVCFVHYHC